MVEPPRCDLCRQPLVGGGVKYYETTVTVHYQDTKVVASRKFYQDTKVVASRKFYHYGACPKPDSTPRPGRFNNLEMP